MSFFNRFKHNSNNRQNIIVIKKETSILNSNNKYTQQLIFKFTFILKSTRFIIEQLAKMIIGDDMSSAKKKLLNKMLYNWKAVLA